MFVGLGVQEGLIIFTVLVIISLHLLMIAHVLRQKDTMRTHKAVWILVIVLFPTRLYTL
jgi:hypothetical protein